MKRIRTHDDNGQTMVEFALVMPILLVAEVEDSALQKLKQGGVETVMGNAAQPEILGATNPSRARHLVIATARVIRARRWT